MKTIKILGTGCQKCQKTVAVVKETLTAENIEAEVVKVEDIQDIMKYNVLSTPAVVLDEEVKIFGHVPTKKEIIALFN